MSLHYNVKRHNSMETERLVGGYIRRWISINALPEMIQLCQLFYEPLFLWCLTNDILDEFKNTKTGQAISSELFDYNNMKFKLELYPNGVTESQKGFVSFRYILISFPEETDNVIFYNEFFCLESNCAYTLTSRFQTSNIHSNGWLKYTLRLKDCIDLKQLTFGLYLDLIRTDYNDNYSLGVYTKYICYSKINTEISYQWFINDILLKEFKNCKYGRYWESECFGVDNNFCLICFPNGYKTERIGNLSLGIKLLRLPNKVSRISVEYELKASYDGSKRKKICVRSTTNFSYQNSVIGWRNGTFPTERLETIETNLWFRVTIKITEIYDMNDNMIPPDQWWGKYTCSFLH
eukprot:84874_1